MVSRETGIDFNAVAISIFLSQDLSMVDSATEWNRTEMFCKWPKGGYWKKEQCADDENRSAEQ